MITVSHVVALECDDRHHRAIEFIKKKNII